MKSRLLSKFSAFKKLESEPKSASFIGLSFSWSTCWVRLSAPDFYANFCTSLLFDVAAVITEHAIFLTAGSGWENMSDIISVMPPDKHKFKLFLGCNSTSSCNSVSLLTKSSLVRFLSGNSLQICCNRSVSLKVYYLRASSSHLRSSFDISLNWEGFVPSWYSIDHLNKPFQSTIFA